MAAAFAFFLVSASGLSLVIRLILSTETKEHTAESRKVNQHLMGLFSSKFPVPRNSMTDPKWLLSLWKLCICRSVTLVNPPS